MKRWRTWLLTGMGLVMMSVFFLAIMRPPGARPATFGQDLPWQITPNQQGSTITVFGLTLGESTVREAVTRFGRRYEWGLFQSPTGRLSLEAYFRDVVVGGLNARLVLSAQLPQTLLEAIRTRAPTSKPTTEGGRRYLLLPEDQELGLGATITAITYLPVVKFDAELVRQRFGQPTEQIADKEGAHWLYPELGLDLLLGDNGEALLQYLPPPEFKQRLQAPLMR